MDDPRAEADVRWESSTIASGSPRRRYDDRARVTFRVPSVVIEDRRSVIDPGRWCESEWNKRHG